MSGSTSWLSAWALGLFGLPGHWEVVIIILVILLLFGGRKLPELGRGLARGLRSFRDELTGRKTDIEDVDKDVKESQTSEHQLEQQGETLHKEQD